MIGSTSLAAFALTEIVVSEGAGVLVVDPFRVGFPTASGEAVLEVGFVLKHDLESTWYRFNLTVDGVFAWRLDQHPGHEAEHGGPWHVHQGPGQNVRIGYGPTSLTGVAHWLHETLNGAGIAALLER